MPPRFNLRPVPPMQGPGGAAVNRQKEPHMHPDNPSFKTTQRRDRIMAGIAALTVSVAINGAVLLCFDSAAPAQWLLPTPALLERLAHCETQHSRRSQDDCKQQVAAAQRQAAPKQDLRLAGR